MKRHVLTLLLLLPVSVMSSQQSNPPSSPDQSSSCCFWDMCWPVKDVCNIASSFFRGLICCHIADNPQLLEGENVYCCLPKCNCLNWCQDSDGCQVLALCTDE